MATTDIHAITQTINLSISYGMSDKVEPVLKDDIADSIKYAMNDKTGEVTYFTLSSTLNCANVVNPAEDFHALINTYGRRELEYGNAKTKDGKPILAWHLIQSFEGQVDPRIANEIGRKLAEELFGNYPVVISTHTNTENTHNHIQFCAWNLDGKKYNYDHAAYDRIRQCSDRICEEYGFSVLEGTRDRKLVSWTDKDGNTRYYEPTDRKNELIRKREAGEISPDDVGSYRNTIPYEVATAKKETNIETVRQAIDSCLPHATSYDHLLFMLRELGFTVKDKKKNGDWLAHITFVPPTAGKGVRDYSIGKDGYYTRENLTAVIEAQHAERRRSEVLQEQHNILYFDNYVYGEIDVQSINEDYRAERAADGSMRIIQRGEAERSIIRDVKASDWELAQRFDTERLRELVAEQNEAQKRRRPPQNRNEILVRQIQEGFVNLKFIEKKQLYSYSQINEIVKGLWGQYNACLSKIGEAEEMIQRLEAVVRAPDILRETLQRMEQGKNDPEYMLEQYQKDRRLMKGCMDSIKKHNISDAASLGSLKENIEKYRSQVSALQEALSSFSTELAAYNRCVATLARIDRASGRDNREFLTAYEVIVKAGQQEAEREREKRKQEKHER